MSIDIIKKNVGVTAANLIQPGMVVGLGTGTTAFYFIQKLIERCKDGLNIQAVSSSKQSMELARQGGIPLIDIDQLTSIDITVDGADEIDSLKQMIKGGGGALVREKIVASMSSEMVVIIDETKLVSQLGKCKLPIEIIPFAYSSTVHRLQKIGYQGVWRKKKDGTLYITDNGNFIFDIEFPQLRENPQADHQAIIQIPGVVDTGFFFNLAGRVVIGFLDGQVIVQP